MSTPVKVWYVPDSDVFHESPLCGALHGSTLPDWQPDSLDLDARRDLDPEVAEAINLRRPCERCRLES